MNVKVKFFLAQYKSPDSALYQHHALCLAEGLEELGIEFYANIQFWEVFEENRYTFNPAPEGYNHNVEIYSTEYYREVKEKIPKRKKGITRILIDSVDGYLGYCLNPVCVESFDLILRTHYSDSFNKLNYKIPANSRYGGDYILDRYNDNTKPWAFGITNRMIKYIDKSSYLEPQPEMVFNSRVPHNLRLIGRDMLDKYLGDSYPMVSKLTDSKDKQTVNSYWARTGRRHSEQYFSDLNSSLVSFCIAGWLKLKPFGKPGNSIINRVYNSIDWRIDAVYKWIPLRRLMILNWDTWRPWEAFLANCCPIQVDYEEWGFVLPEMPIHGEHYWSIRNLDFKNSCDELKALSHDEVKRIGQQGKDWALKHYAPKPTAERFLRYLKELPEEK